MYRRSYISYNVLIYILLLIYYDATALYNIGHEKKTINNKRTKQSKKTTTAEEIPLILNDTYQRLDTYSKGVKNLFNAVRKYF